jgi:hypothetical protein
MEEQYKKQWQLQFASRLRTGRMIQRFFGKTSLTNLFIQSFQTFPFLAKPLIRQTHGNPF